MGYGGGCSGDRASPTLMNGYGRALGACLVKPLGAGLPTGRLARAAASDTSPLVLRRGSRMALGQQASSYQNSEPAITGATMMSVGAVLTRLYSLAKALSYQLHVPQDFYRVEQIMYFGTLAGRVEDGLISTGDVARLESTLRNPALALREIDRIVSLFRSGLSPSSIVGEEGLPFCLRDAGTTTECFLDPRCLAETSVHWWGFVFYFCDIFWDRNCPCRAVEVTWLDVALFALVALVLKNPRLLVELIKKIAARIPVPTPTPIPIAIIPPIGG